MVTLTTGSHTTTLQAEVFVHHTQRGAQTQRAGFVAGCANNVHRVGPRTVAVDGVAGGATAPASGDVDPVVHRRDRETARPRLGELVDGGPPAGDRVERAHRADGPLGDADSQHRMFGDRLRDAAQDVQHVVDGSGKLAGDSLPRYARHLRPRL